MQQGKKRIDVSIQVRILRVSDALNELLIDFLQTHWVLRIAFGTTCRVPQVRAIPEVNVDHDSPMCLQLWASHSILSAV